jgi:glycosyltransferase involved in cell wall biosynthesis
MRIAWVVAGGVDESGVERVTPSVLWQIERLARHHEVHVYVLRYHHRPRTYQLLGATVHDLGRPDGIRRQYAATIDAIRRHGRPDVLHGMLALPAGFVAAAAGRRLGVPSVVTCDSGEFVGLDDIGYGAQATVRQRWAVRLLARLASRIVVCTTYQAQLAAACGVRTVLLPIGVDTSRFQPPVAAPPDGPPWRLLQVASLNRVKDQRTLVAAFARLTAAGVDARLDVAGEDTLGGAIQQEAARLGIAPRVTFHGPLPSASLAVMYQHAHLFVLSSRHEGGPVVALEAAASGLPIVGTEVGYVADWNGDRAVGVPPHDPARLADAIASLIADPSRRARLAASARDWVLRHDADWTAGEHDRLYHRLAAA